MKTRVFMFRDTLFCVEDDGGELRIMIDVNFCSRLDFIPVPDPSFALVNAAEAALSGSYRDDDHAYESHRDALLEKEVL
jgi:hypothetical protein